MTLSWKNPPPDLRLSTECVDVWRTRLDLPEEQINTYLALLSADEIERARRFKVKRKYREYVITRGLLRNVLGQTLDSDPGSFQFEYAEHAKPCLDEDWDGKPVSFNVSHSHNQALIAITLDRNIGIDIEKIRSDVDFRRLAKRFFSTQESGALDKLDETSLPTAFFACWTRKEAFVKALGDGISFGLSEFSVSTDPGAEQVSLATHWNPSEASEWSLANIRSETGYIAAIAVQQDSFKLRCWR